MEFRLLPLILSAWSRLDHESDSKDMARLYLSRSRLEMAQSKLYHFAEARRRGLYLGQIVELTTASYARPQLVVPTLASSHSMKGFRHRIL